MKNQVPNFSIELTSNWLRSLDAGHVKRYVA